MDTYNIVRSVSQRNGIRRSEEALKEAYLKNQGFNKPKFENTRVFKHLSQRRCIKHEFPHFKTDKIFVAGSLVWLVVPYSCSN